MLDARRRELINQSRVIPCILYRRGPEGRPEANVGPDEDIQPIFSEPAEALPDHVFALEGQRAARAVAKTVAPLRKLFEIRAQVASRYDH